MNRRFKINFVSHRFQIAHLKDKIQRILIKGPIKAKQSQLKNLSWMKNYIIAKVRFTIKVN